MDLGFINIDLAAMQHTLLVFLLRPPAPVLLDLLSLFGWGILSYVLIQGGVLLWVKYRQARFTHDWKWVLLAVDVPPLNVQPPIAVEQMFSQLTGAFNHVDITEKFWHGFRQQWFSFEIISIGGYIQFLIRTESKFRDLVEAAIYAQYPDAQVVEVEDYVTPFPSRFPDKEYDIWAADFSLTENWAYPIRTYKEFETRIGRDTIIKDPMAALLESFSRIGPGEQMWLQMLVEPTSGHWKEEVIANMAKMTGAKEGHGGKSWSDHLTDFSLKSLETIGDQIFNREEGIVKEEKKEQKKELSPGQGALLEAMETKIKKDGFWVKLRGVYIARKEVFKKDKGVHALVGAIAQFNIPSANSLAARYKTVATSFFAKQRILRRKRLLMQAYKKRKMISGGNGFLFNIEELATVWHFPLSHVKTPLVQKAAAKAAEPPAGLPVEISSDVRGLPIAEPIAETAEQKYQTDAGEINYDSGPRFG